MVEEYWLEVVRKNTKEGCKIFAFANKSEQRERMTEEEVSWCERNEVEGYQVSAKTGEGVV